MQHPCYVFSVLVLYFLGQSWNTYVAEGSIEVNLPVGTRNRLHRDLGNGVMPAVR